MSQCDRPKISGVVLLRSDAAALLQWRDNKPEIDDPGLWVFPGGHCEPNEPGERCAARELYEETLYRCDSLRYLDTYSGKELGYQRDFELSFYWARFDNIQTYTCCEGQALRFVSPEEAEALPMPAYLRRVWSLALQAAGLNDRLSDKTPRTQPSAPHKSAK